MRNFWDEQDVIDLAARIYGEENIQHLVESKKFFLNSWVLFLNAAGMILTGEKKISKEDKIFLGQIISLQSSKGYLYPPLD